MCLGRQAAPPGGEVAICLIVGEIRLFWASMAFDDVTESLGTFARALLAMSRTCALCTYP